MLEIHTILISNYIYIYLSAEEPVEITKPLKNLDVKEGEKAVFTCEVSKPDLAAKWSHDDKDISEEDGYDITATGKTHTLSLEEVEVADAGKYKVKIKDKESTGKLKVQGIFDFMLQSNIFLEFSEKFGCVLCHI